MVAPSSKLVDESGGSMIFTIPFTQIKEITPLFKLIEEEFDFEGEDMNMINPSIVELKSIIKDIGISHTTLEEVFMKVTGKKVSKFNKEDN